MMKINKREALALVKVLNQHGVGSDTHLASTSKTDHQNTLEDLADRMDAFLVHDEPNCCDVGSDDAKAADDGGEEEEDSAEEDEEDDEEESDEDDSDSDDDDALDCDYECTAGELHDLEAVKSSKGAVEFEEVDSHGSCQLILDGSTEHSVAYLRRSSKALHVIDDRENVHVYNINRFPKAWVTFFPLDELIEVVAETSEE